MSRIINYDSVLCYKVRMQLSGPLHIGSSENGKSDILTHPVTGIPFIQASSIAGACRAYISKNDPEMMNYLFGADSDDSSSRIRFSDGIIEDENNGIQMEFRPRVKLNRNTGTVSSEKTAFADSEKGHKFEMLLVGAGAYVDFSVYIYTEKNGNDFDEIKNVAMDMFSAINSGEILLGGQKSNGCGYFTIDKLIFLEYDMTDSDSRIKWMKESILNKSDFENYENISKQLENTETRKNNDYRIEIKGKTDGELIVKGIALSDFGENAPDSINIRNSKGDYIVPGSSLKGAIRNRMTMIAEYMNGVDSEEIIGNTFGIDKKSIGNIYFSDMVVGNIKANDMMPIRNRIRIDKLTGGVMYKGNFKDKNISGPFEMNIAIKDINSPEKSFGLLILALRDLAAGAFSIGGGSNVGKGYLNIEKISIRKNDAEAIIDVKENKIIDENNLIRDGLVSIKSNTSKE